MVFNADALSQHKLSRQHLATWSPAGHRVLVLAIAKGVCFVPESPTLPFTFVKAPAPSARKPGARQINTVVDAVLVTDVFEGVSTLRLLCCDIVTIEVWRCGDCVVCVVQLTWRHHGCGCNRVNPLVACRCPSGSQRWTSRSSSPGRRCVGVGVGVRVGGCVRVVRQLFRNALAARSTTILYRLLVQT